MKAHECGLILKVMGVIPPISAQLHTSQWPLPGEHEAGRAVAASKWDNGCWSKRCPGSHGRGCKGTGGELPEHLDDRCVRRGVVR